jgi:hypothetical protein
MKLVRWDPEVTQSGRDYRTKGHNPGELSWVPVPTKVFSAARKVSTIEECR